MNCILNVTGREYDRILQMNHDAVAWETTDRYLVKGLRQVLGERTVREMCAYDECRMQKHDDLAAYPRIEPGVFQDDVEQEQSTSQMQESMNTDLGVAD